MASPTQTANEALDLIGAAVVISIDDTTGNAPVCKRNYAQAVLEVSAAHDWGFLRKIATLAQGTAPAFGWDYSYPLPVDYVAMRQINGNAWCGEPTDLYEISGRNVVTDAETAEVVYTANVTDTTYFSPLFCAALAALLAYKIVGSIKQNGPEEAPRLWQLYQLKLTQARMTDGNMKKSRRYDPASESRFVNSRLWGRH